MDDIHANDQIKVNFHCKIKDTGIKYKVFSSKVLKVKDKKRHFFFLEGQKSQGRLSCQVIKTIWPKL